jgi:hypothetical protein
MNLPTEQRAVNERLGHHRLARRVSRRLRRAWHKLSATHRPALATPLALMCLLQFWELNFLAAVKLWPLCRDLFDWFRAPPPLRRSRRGRQSPEALPRRASA